MANRVTTEAKVLSASTIYEMIHHNRTGKIEMVNLRRKGCFKRPAEKFNDGGRTIKKRDKLEFYLENNFKSL